MYFIYNDTGKNMSKLAKAFASSEKQEERAQSLFNNIFSSPIFRGFYEKETPEVDIKMTGSDLEQKRLTYLINTIAKNSPRLTAFSG